MGKSTTYKPPEQEHLTRLSFDENSPIMRVEGNIDWSDTMLANYAANVSENLYEFNTGKF